MVSHRVHFDVGFEGQSRDVGGVLRKYWRLGVDEDVVKVSNDEPVEMFAEYVVN